MLTLCLMLSIMLNYVGLLIKQLNFDAGLQDFMRMVMGNKQYTNDGLILAVNYVVCKRKY